VRGELVGARTSIEVEVGLDPDDEFRKAVVNSP
jgi:hypothetical protein